MDRDVSIPSRRIFLERLGGAGAALTLGACATAAAASAPAPARGEWDVSWIDRVRRARHRMIFDETKGDSALMHAARYFNNMQAAYGAAAPDVLAVVNLRVGATSIGLSHAMWQKYPIGDDRHVTDATTGAPARRNVNYSPAPGASAGEAEMTLERLYARGTIYLVCDFALGHMATRLAEKVGATADAVHRELRDGVVPGAFVVPSGIFGLGEAQNAGCALMPAVG